MDSFARPLPICKFDCFRTSALRDLQQCEHLTKNLGRIPAVDFFNYQHEWPIWFALCGLDRLHQYSVDEFKSPIASGPPAAHEVLIGKRWVKLDNAQSG